jgi:hypothetical protein
MAPTQRSDDALNQGKPIVRSFALIEVRGQTLVTANHSIAPFDDFDWLLLVITLHTEQFVCSSFESQSSLSGLTSGRGRFSNLISSRSCV